MTGPVRVVLADDQVAVRAGLALILSAAPGIEVVGQAADGESTVALCRALRPDVAVLDVRIPRLDGISATREVVAANLADVLVLTRFDLDEYVFAALRAGAAASCSRTPTPTSWSRRSARSRPATGSSRPR